jgi:enediyne biosynthesis protein E4
VACGDLDGDGRLDLAVTNFYGESTTFFHNLGQGAFADRTAAVGLAAPSRNLLGFGIAFLDVDNDGRLDLMTANGHVDDYRPGIPYAMPIQLLRGGADGRLRDVSGRAGPPFLLPHLGRGLAAGDLDNDGQVDALVIAHDEPMVFLHNRTRAGHSVTFALEGTASNRDGVGASVAVVSGSERRVAQRVGGGSYQSAGDPRLHIGLGDVRSIDAVEVRWPSGRVDRHRDLPADAGYLLREGDARVRPLPGWR